MVGIAAPGEPFWGDLGQTLCQGDSGFMGKTCKENMFEGFQLVFKRRVNGRMGMTKEVDPPGADGIEITVSLKVLEPDPEGPFYGDGGPLFVVLHLGTGVPENLEVAGSEVLII